MSTATSRVQRPLPFELAAISASINASNDLGREWFNVAITAGALGAPPDRMGCHEGDHAHPAETRPAAARKMGGTGLEPVTSCL